MIDLYTAGTPNGHKASIALEAIGLACTAASPYLSNGAKKYPDSLPESGL